MELNLKRTLTCIILTVLTTLSTHAQTLCVIDGTPLPDSLLHVTIDEMRSDSAKEIVATGTYSALRHRIHSDIRSRRADKAREEHHIL